jgi:hypothetical protein
VRRWLCIAASMFARSVFQPSSASPVTVDEDNVLGAIDTEPGVLNGITSRQRTEEQKTNLYTKLVEELKACGIVQSDIVVSIVTNSDADWSFASETDGHSSSPSTRRKGILCFSYQRDVG